MRVRRVMGAAVLTAVTALLAGCGAGDAAGDAAGERLVEKAIEDAASGDVDVEYDDDSITVESEDGTFAFGAGEVPASFPSEIPVPDGTIVSSLEQPDGGMVSVEVDDVAAAFDEVVATLEEAGWTQEMITTSDQVRSAAFSRGEDEVGVMALGEDAIITVTVRVAEPAG